MGNAQAPVQVRLFGVIFHRRQQVVLFRKVPVEPEILAGIIFSVSLHLHSSLFRPLPPQDRFILPPPSVPPPGREKFAGEILRVLPAHFRFQGQLFEDSERFGIAFVLFPHPADAFFHGSVEIRPPSFVRQGKVAGRRKPRSFKERQNVSRPSHERILKIVALLHLGRRIIPEPHGIREGEDSPGRSSPRQSDRARSMPMEYRAPSDRPGQNSPGEAPYRPYHQPWGKSFRRDRGTTRSP